MVVAKFNGDVRVCVDMCRVNKVVIRERYLILIFEEILAVFNGVVVFLKFDLRWGYY